MKQTSFLFKNFLLFNLSSSSQYKLIFFLTLGILSFFVSDMEAQDKSNRFFINLQGSIYAQQKDKSSLYVVSPEPRIEVLCSLYNAKKFSAHTGLQYTYNHWHKEVGAKSEWRRKTHEIALPIFVKQQMGKYILLKGGANTGYLLKGKMEYKSNIPANPKWQDVTYQTNYEESSRFYLELFFSSKFKCNPYDRNTLAIGPTIKHSLVEHWMDNIRPRTMYGISLEYSFSF